MKKDTKTIIVVVVVCYFMFIEDSYFLVWKFLNFEFLKLLKCILKLEVETTHIKSSIKVLISKITQISRVHNHP